MTTPENTAPADQARGSETSDNQATNLRTERDFWDYVEILARPVAAFITALAVASIGIFGNLALNKSNRLAQYKVEMEQNSRLYTELLSSREEADSNLRKDMFTTILGEFLTTGNDLGNDPVSALSDRMLKLELLALNFGDSLSLRPLFQEINRDVEREARTIQRSSGVNASEYFESLFLPRLRSLARRVSDRQSSLLSAGGSTFTISVKPEAAGAGNGQLQNIYQWPHDAAQASWEIYPAKENEIETDWVQEQASYMQTIDLGEITRTYDIALSRADLRNSEVTVDLTIQDISGPNISLIPLKMTFKLNFFNFPMIDNTRISGDQRFALVLKKFNQEEILIEGICFPGLYASHRDKPFLNDVIDQLRRNSEEFESTMNNPM